MSCNTTTPRFGGTVRRGLLGAGRELNYRCIISIIRKHENLGRFHLVDRSINLEFTGLEECSDW